MPNPLVGRQAKLRSLITTFLAERRDGKLEKLTPDDPNRTKLQLQFEHHTWINDAARRVAQLQVATHTLKPIHPDARGTNLYRTPASLATLPVVGTHALGTAFDGDVVGNAAALDVDKFLKLAHEGRSLLDLMLARDPDLAAALSSDSAQADAWLDAFTGITQPRGRTASHTLAKQLYWRVGEDPLDDASYHLLAPLYASSLAHRMHGTINTDRFSDEAKAARHARREGAFSERPVNEYPNLAVQKLGGTKPQNIGQLNHERHGSSYLLASLPPSWTTRDTSPILHVRSAFSRFEDKPRVKQLLKTLLTFLKTDPRKNIQTRTRRHELVIGLLDALTLFTAEHRLLDAGWSQRSECELTAAQKHWLDLDGVAQAHEAEGTPLPTDSANVVSLDFARWLNAHLRDPLPMGEPEFLHWRTLALQYLQEEAWEVRHVA